MSSGFAQKITRAVADAARPLPLAAVRLTGGPLKQAQDLDAAYLLALDPDRMLAPYRQRSRWRCAVRRGAGFAVSVNGQAGAAERARVRALEAATLVSVEIGDCESEKRFNSQGVETSVIRTDGRSGRRAIRWFSYDLPLAASGEVGLVATYNSDQRRPRSFAVLVDGTRVGAEAQAQSSVARFDEKEYAIPAELRPGKKSLTVRFEAADGLEVTPVFGVRLVRR